MTNRERFEDIVRHEIGHAVHESKDSEVNSWLENRFGWRVFDSSELGIDQWVEMMGGWGGLTPSQEQDVRDSLRTALGPGKRWAPGPTPSLPQDHPWYTADFGPRLAFERTGANWYRNFQTWHRSNGRAFFLNYWYCTLMAVDSSTLDLVAVMPDAYASMSHYEFFAELYALYFDLDDDHRSAIPADVAMWLDQNIGAPEPDAPMLPAPTAKREWETITRPQKQRKRTR